MQTPNSPISPRTKSMIKKMMVPIGKVSVTVAYLRWAKKAPATPSASESGLPNPAGRSLPSR